MRLNHLLCAGSAALLFLLVGLPTITCSQEAKGLDETLGKHFIQLDANNSFGGSITGIDAKTGKTTGIAKIDVYLVQRSRSIAKTKTDDKGQFKFQK